MTTYETPTVDGPHVERTWTTLAADRDGVPAADLIGVRRLEREAWFSQKAEAELWLAVQELDGFELSGPTPLATFYHGPTDSPSNAWAARAWVELRLIGDAEAHVNPSTGAIVGPAITNDAIAELEQAAGFEEWSR